LELAVSLDLRRADDSARDLIPEVFGDDRLDAADLIDRGERGEPPGPSVEPDLSS